MTDPFDGTATAELGAWKFCLQTKQDVAARELVLPLPEQFPHQSLDQVALRGACRELLPDHDAEPRGCPTVVAYVQHEVLTATTGPQSKNG